MNKFHIHFNFYSQFKSLKLLLRHATHFFPFCCSVACSFIAHDVIVFNKNRWRGKLWKFILTTFIETKENFTHNSLQKKQSNPIATRLEEKCFTTRLCKFGKIELVLVFRPSNCKTMKIDSSSSVISKFLRSKVHTSDTENFILLLPCFNSCGCKINTNYLVLFGNFSSWYPPDDAYRIY
jgi:hypothetical protein